MSTALCATVRDEAPYIMEWIAHHLATGFDQLFIYDNGSSDNTAAVVSAASETLPVKLIQWSDHSPKFQTNAYKHCVSMLKGRFDWLSFLDGDELLVPQRDFYVGDFLAQFGSEVAVALPWQIFGSSRHQEKPQGLVSMSYLRRAEHTFSANKHVKSIVRPEVVEEMTNPHAFTVRGRYVNVDCTPVEWASDGVTDKVTCPEIAHVNHYFVKSEEEWANKVQRGHRDGTIRSQQDFALYDRNEVFDGYAVQYATKVLSLIEAATSGRSGLGSGKTHAPLTLAAKKPYKLSVEEFSSEDYLMANPDVAEAEFSAIHHYFNLGVHEGRVLRQSK